MPNLIAHIVDWDAFVEELGDLAITEEGKTHFKFDHTPFIRNGNEALVNLLNPPGSFAGMDSVDLLGDYTAVFAAPPKKAIYDRIYPRPVIDMTDFEGEEYTYQAPEYFGVFAE